MHDGPQEKSIKRIQLNISEDLKEGQDSRVDDMEDPTHRRIETPKPEAGIAEWTSKIKALQRDVDADGELEQKRLEEEIRASRLARSRRSGGAQFAGRASLGGVTEHDEKASSPSDALRKLSGEPTSPLPPTGVAANNNNNSPSAPSLSDRKPSTTPNSKPDPVSLASFIGGRASGPRLNRPVPQPDAHDPTLFEQRTRKDIERPHPVFGSGGVALVGLVEKGREVVGPGLKTQDRERNESVPRKEQEVRIVKGKPTNTTATASTDGPAGGAAPTKPWARERTLSTPAPYVPPKPAERSQSNVIPIGSPGVRNRVDSLYAHANRSVERVTSPPVLRGSKSTDKIGQRPAAPAKPEALRKPQVVTDIPQRTSPTSFTASAATPPPKTPTRATSTSPSVSVPSLAKPIHPHQRPLSTGPQIPQSRNPAPAFLKPAQQKDLTPSLSRLQGRGFVQSFVKLSSEIEAASTTGSSGGGGLGSPERSAPSPKKSSVLDRWNPPNAPPSASPRAASSVSAPPLRKAKTFDAPRTTPLEVTSSPVAEPVRPTPQPKPRSLVSATKATPTKTKPVPAPGDVLPLGSSNTLISYIKTTKTGDAPVTDQPEAAAAHPRSKTPSRHADENASGNGNNVADEHGVRRPRSRNSNVSRSPSPKKAASVAVASSPREHSKVDLASSVPGGRPLSHPTKDRAKLRRRGVGGQGPSESREHTSPTTLDEEPVVAPAPERMSERKEEPSSLSRPFAPAPPSTPKREEVPTTTPGQTRGANVRRLQDAWSNQAPISVKPIRKPSLVTPSPSQTSFGHSEALPKTTKYALPGLAKEEITISPPSPPLTPPLSVSARREREHSTSSPVRHGRIPSTGSRATVMDVAQAFSNIGAPPVSPSVPKSPGFPTAPRSPNPRAKEEVERVGEGDPGRWEEAENERTITPAIMKAERRRSTIEKYASFTLPVLPEEKTPESSPAGTLKRGVDASTLDAASGGFANRVEGAVRVAEKKPVPPKKPDFARTPSKVHIDVVDEPLPSVSASRIWDVSPPRFVPDPDVHTVSVEVLNVESGSAMEISKGADNLFVFYETETLVIVHRAKSRSSGLVVTKVWAWSGRKAEVGEREERKMQELAKRFGTVLLRCGQCAEPQELVNVLGGSLIVRQGKRSLWSSENTTMHSVRSVVGVIVIDEVDLDVKNLCSGFSYCISLLDTLWVWYGCGSAIAERDAALRYAQTLISGVDSSEKRVVEVEEGQEDEMFWMFLGEDGYASAAYWKWRKSEKGVDPRFWRVDCANSGSEVKELEIFPPPSDVSNAVLVVHLAYEIFALVGAAARGQRRNIKLGLTLAQELSSHTARSKPFRPPVHVLIFPSQIPLDLRAAVRGLDAEPIHGSDNVPDHMNLLTLAEAWTQLRQKEWNQNELEDTNMMPLGLTPN